MATNPATAKWAHPEPTQIQEHHDDEEEEEALSLSDLPINNQQNHQPAKEAETPPNPMKQEEDFDFKSWGGSLLTHPQMCAADDVFFQGQIIPLRHSVSSEAAALSRTPSRLCISRSGSIPSRRCFSRSESMDRFHSMTGFNTSTSVANSRSSSVRSSLRSSSSGSSTATTTTTYQKPHNKVLNHFHSHPSPSPQIRITTSRYASTGNRVPQSRVWNFLRVGLVRTPEMELQGLKNRNGSRNGNNKSGFGSRNSNSSSSSSSTSSGGKKEKKKNNNKQRLFGNNGFFGGGSCKCSVDAVETMPLRAANTAEEEEEKGKEKTTTKEKKQTASRHRTFEWLKELSDHAGVPD